MEGIALVAFCVGLQWVAAVFAILLKTEKFFDLVGTGSFALIAISNLLTRTLCPRQHLVNFLVLIWSVRLCTFLVNRVHTVGKDSRFEAVKHNPVQFFVYWTLQAVWIVVTLLPVTLAQADGDVSLHACDFFGAAVWLVGFLFEATADAQKWRFKLDAQNRGKFISHGLWRVCRHPNYFGEITLWWGIFIIEERALRTLSIAAWLGGLAGPVFLMLLLCFMSGIPILEAQARQRWGKTAEYQRYSSRTPVLIPYIKLLDFVLVSGE